MTRACAITLSTALVISLETTLETVKSAVHGALRYLFFSIGMKMSASVVKERKREREKRKAWIREQLDIGVLLVFRALASEISSLETKIRSSLSIISRKQFLLVCRFPAYRRTSRPYNTVNTLTNDPLVSRLFYKTRRFVNI